MSTINNLFQKAVLMLKATFVLYLRPLTAALAVIKMALSRVKLAVKKHLESVKED